MKNIKDNKKILISGLVIVVVSFLAILKLTVFSYAAEVDISEYEVNIKISENVQNGNGTATAVIMKYPVVARDEVLLQELQQVIHSAKVELDKDKNLSNGDEVTARVVLNEELAKKYKIKLTGEKVVKKTVENLLYRVDNIDKVKDKLNRIDSVVHSIFMKNFGPSYRDINANLVKKYYKNADNDSSSNQLKMIYEYDVNYNMDSFSSSDEKNVSEYYFVEIRFDRLTNNLDDDSKVPAFHVNILRSYDKDDTKGIESQEQYIERQGYQEIKN